MPTILIADPDIRLLQEVETQLPSDGFRVVGVDNIQQIIDTARESLPDVAVVSLDFDEMDSIETCKQLRLQPHLTYLPILFTTINKSRTVSALEAGGDDLIAKPFEVRELTARIRALVRRTQRLNRLNELQLNRDTSRVWINGEEVNLTPTEFLLLAYLCEYRTQFHAAETLLSTVWDYPNASGDTALVRNHIHNIREKLEKNANRPQIIVSLHGRGYGINAIVDIVGQNVASQDVRA